MAMKSLSIDDLKKDGWKVSKKTREAVASIKASKNIAEAMIKIAEAMAMNIEFIKDIATVVEAIPEKLQMLPAPIITVEPPSVTIEAPNDKTKRNFRFSIVRDEEGFIKHVDVKQI